ncbi:MAG: DUF423 domain-containing protein [Pseudolabrys sp.]|jgi:uncharacterized membrane protein YgdD (TMEM256/DUF423 family)
MDTIVIALAGLMGAAGVILAAAGAHGKTGMGLDSAGYLLLIHACAAIAVAIAIRNGMIFRPVATIATIGFILGAALFAADVTLRAYTGHRLFPMAAPTGGTIMILGWLALSVCALISSRG